MVLVASTIADGLPLTLLSCLCDIFHMPFCSAVLCFKGCSSPGLLQGP